MDPGHQQGRRRRRSPSHLRRDRLRRHNILFVLF